MDSAKLVTMYQGNSSTVSFHSLTLSHVGPWFPFQRTFTAFLAGDRADWDFL